MPPIPFEVPSPQIPFVVMSGEAGATPLRVLFDSGAAAPFEVILSEARGAAIAEPTGEPAVTIAAVAGGGTASLTPAILPNFRLGAVTLTNARAALSRSIDLVSARLPGGIDAVVGYEFAAGRVVAIDYAARTIDFSAAPGRGEARPMTIAPEKPLTMIDVAINGRGPFRMALDTGAGANLLSPGAALRAGLGTAGRTVTIGGAGGVGSEARIEPAELAAGAHRWPATHVVVADLMDEVSAEAGATVDGVLGAPLLAQGRLILDYVGHRVWIGVNG